MLDRILIGSSAEPSDPNFKNVTLLLHGDGSNGAQNNTFIDSSTNNFTITRNGNTTQGSFSPYGSNWSCVYDGSGDYNRISSNETALQFGTGDFTIEGWVFSTNGTGTYQQILTGGTSWTSGSGGVYWYYNGGSPYIGAAWNQVATNPAVNSGTLATNTWHHFAFVRSGNTLTLYVNGTSVDTLDVTGTSLAVNNQSQTNIGGGGWDQDFAGYLSNLRVLKGTALYTSNFTPSTTPLTAITNTSLLTCAYNRFRDGSTNNFTITRNGDVKVTNFAPFAPSSAYSTTTNGGSAYFDGSGDYLSVARNTAFIPTTGDFTIEAWVYPTTSGTTRFIMGLLEQGTAGDWSIFLHTNDTLGFFAGGADSFGGTVTPYQWNHVAISRSGSTIYKCVNGTATTATFTNSLDSSTGYNLTIGADNAGDEILFYGWMTDARVVKGTAIYTSTTYTVPTAPLTAVTNTGFLAKFQNAAIFDNSMKNDLETVGNAQISTSVKKFGTGSMYFDGTGDQLSIPSSDALSLGTGNFTIELWMYHGTGAYVNSQPVLIQNWSTTWAANYWSFHADHNSGTAGKFTLWVHNFNSGSSPMLTSTSTSKTSTWNHVAIVRNGNSFAMYVNGVSEATATFSGSMDGGGTWPIYIGGPNQAYDGYIDDVRITKGIARYTANFTAPTAPFPNK